MYKIIEVNLLQHCFDFQRALIGIHAVFKEKNVKNYLLFSEMDLRNRWTKLEMKRFRKENDNTFYYFKTEDVYPQDILTQLEGKEEAKIIDNNVIAEKEKKIEKNLEKINIEENKSFKLNIKEGDIDDDNDNRGAILIEKHEEQKNKDDLEELD